MRVFALLACDRVVVRASDDATVRASGMCVVYAHESAHVWAGSAVAVYKAERFGAFRGRVEGGRVIVKRPADEMTGEQWCRAALVQVDEAGLAHLFKATDRDGVSRRGGAYQVGELVDDSENWTGDRFLAVVCMCRRRRVRRSLVLGLRIRAARGFSR